MIDGLDVSHWNNVRWVDWKKMGYVFVWMKATEGTSFVDNKWRQHYQEAREQDFYVAPYHYFRVRWNGAVQAKHFHDEVKGQEWDMPPMVDVERTNNLGYDKAVFAARLRNFLFECEKLFGVKPIIYASRYSWRSLVGSVAWSTAYDLWVAHYTTKPVPLIPDDWKGKGWKVWQYTSSPLDQNRFNGDLADFLRWIGRELSPPDDRLEALELRVSDLVETLQSVE